MSKVAVIYRASSRTLSGLPYPTHYDGFIANWDMDGFVVINKDEGGRIFIHRDEILSIETTPKEEKEK